MLFPVNHNTNTEKEAKVNTPHILRCVIDFSFKDDILGEIVLCSRGKSLKGRGESSEMLK